MAVEKIPSVVILDSEEGSLLGELSASDLRGISSERISDVNLPVLEFLLKQNSGKPVAIVAALSMNETLEKALQLVTKHRFHRVWIIGEGDLRPIGILTLTDIFKSFIPWLQK